MEGNKRFEHSDQCFFVKDARFKKDMWVKQRKWQMAICRLLLHKVV